MVTWIPSVVWRKVYKLSFTCTFNHRIFFYTKKTLYTLNNLHPFYYLLIMSSKNPSLSKMVILHLYVQCMYINLIFSTLHSTVHKEGWKGWLHLVTTSPTWEEREAREAEGLGGTDQAEATIRHSPQCVQQLAESLQRQEVHQPQSGEERLTAAVCGSSALWQVSTHLLSFFLSFGLYKQKCFLGKCNK